MTYLPAIAVAAALAFLGLTSCTGSFTKDGQEYEYSITPKVKEEKSLKAPKEAPADLEEVVVEASAFNPLDSLAETERTAWHSPAWGTFGPGGGSIPYRPELIRAMYPAAE